MEAAVREVDEEIGVKLQPSELEFIKTFHWDREESELVFSLYRVRCDSKELDVVLAPVEHDSFDWFDPKELSDRDDLMIGLYKVLEDLYDSR